MNNGALDVDISHNTSLQTGSIVFSDGRPDPGFVYRDNIAPQNAYGIIGTDTGVGNGTHAVYFPGAQLHKNVIIGGSASVYPAGNYFPTSLSGVGFMDPTIGDYRLAPGSAYKSAADDDKDIGVNMGELCAALQAYGKGLAITVPSCVPAP
jgi:hypothetical protein